MKYKLRLTIIHNQLDWSVTITRKKLQIGIYKGTWAEWGEGAIPKVVEDTNSYFPSGIAKLAEERLETLKGIKDTLESLLCTA